MKCNAANCFRAITLEPVMLIYFSSLTLSQVGGQALLLQKACHPGNLIPSTSAICDSEEESQKTVTDIQSWKDLIVLFGPVFFVLFAGAWSDKHGKKRKPLMWLPLCGQILADGLTLVNVYFWNWSPIVAALSMSIPPAMTGWRSCFLIGVVCYISDITAENLRTVRSGIVSAIYFLGSPIGALIFGFLFREIGFYGVFLLCVVLNLVALLCLVFVVRENECEEEEEEEMPKLKAWEGLIDPRGVVQSFKTLVKPREGYRRAVVLLMVLAAPITMAPLQGEFSILLLFVRYKFKWDEVDFGFYAAYKCIVIFCGTVVSTGLFSRLWGLPDAVIGCMASTTLILASVCYAFSSTTWQLFACPAIDFMHGASLGIVYSIVSKIVADLEFGQVNSMLGVADALFPLVNVPLYNQVYKHTFPTMAGAVFFISGIYGAVAFVIFGLVYTLQRVQKHS